MKSLCAGIGAFFLFAGIAVLAADLVRAAPRAGSGSSAFESAAPELSRPVRSVRAAASRRPTAAPAAVVSRRR